MSLCCEAEAIVSGGVAGTSDCNNMGMVGWRVESALKGAIDSLTRTEIGPGPGHVNNLGTRAASGCIGSSVGRPHKTAAEASLFGGRFTGTQILNVISPMLSLFCPDICAVIYLVILKT